MFKFPPQKDNKASISTVSPFSHSVLTKEWKPWQRTNILKMTASLSFQAGNLTLTNLFVTKIGISLGSLEFSHPSHPKPMFSLICDFSAKVWVRGGVGGNIPRNLYWSQICMFHFPADMVPQFLRKLSLLIKKQYPTGLGWNSVHIPRVNLFLITVRNKEQDNFSKNVNFFSSNYTAFCKGCGSIQQEHYFPGWAHGHIKWIDIVIFLSVPSLTFELKANVHVWTNFMYWFTC